MARAVWWRRSWVMGIGIGLLAGVVVIGAAVVWVARHAEPILRRSVVETLAGWFHSPVELDGMSISVARGIEVRGTGLRIMHLAGAGRAGAEQNPDLQRGAEAEPQVQGEMGAGPMVSVREFTFRTSLRDLLQRRARIAMVHVEGMELRIPPHAVGEGFRKGEPGEVKAPKPRIALLVGKIECVDTKLFIATTKPGKQPLEFDIPSLELTDVGQGRALLYVADVVNPKPRGDVHAFGSLGPWVAEDPRSTAIDGEYRFEHADLSTIKGLGGMLSSTGRYAGQLGRITIDGETETPDFSLDVSRHPVRLATKFHAIVDGTTGDTTLAPVEARMGHSEFTATGTVMRVQGKGHDIAMKVTMPRGRIEDLLQLGMKTEPPVMRGAVTLEATLHIPPGPVKVAEKMELQGRMGVREVVFGNASLQDKVDGLSLRAQGRPKEVKTAASDGKAEVQSTMAVTFSLAGGMVKAKSLEYEVPGAKVVLAGVYSMDGSVFEFKGRVRTEATASQMVTGWKSWLLKAVDPFLKKDGAGVELPVSISGAGGDVKFGLAGRDADESTEAMAADLKVRGVAMRERAEAKRLAEKADREDVEAAREKDLGKAEAIHNRAVEDRAAAQRHAGAAVDAEAGPK